MKINAKNVTKMAGAVCAATGIVTLSALTASGAAVGAIVEGFKTANNTMKKLLADGTEKETSVGEQPEDDSAVEDNASEIESTSEEIITE